VLLYRWLVSRRLEGLLPRGAGWIGQHSLSLFMVHQPIIIVLLPVVVAGPVRVLGGLLMAVALTLIGGIALEWAVRRAEERWNRWRRRAWPCGGSPNWWPLHSSCTAC